MEGRKPAWAHCLTEHAQPSALDCSCLLTSPWAFPSPDPTFLVCILELSIPGLLSMPCKKWKNHQKLGTPKQPSCFPASDPQSEQAGWRLWNPMCGQGCGDWAGVLRWVVPGKREQEGAQCEE